GQDGCGSLARDSADAYFLPHRLARRTSVLVHQGRLYVSARKGADLRGNPPHEPVHWPCHWLLPPPRPLLPPASPPPSPLPVPQPAPTPPDNPVLPSRARNALALQAGPLLPRSLPRRRLFRASAKPPAGTRAHL